MGADPVRPVVDSSATMGGTGALSGGAMTVYTASSQAFGQPGPTLSPDQLAAFEAGDEAFESTFVPAPAPVHPGLGPLYDNVACSACHHNDGRGHPPVSGEQFASMLFRVSVPGSDAHGGPAPAPGFGLQFELHAAVGYTPMAAMSVQYTDSVDSYADGTADTLHVPHYTIGAPYQALPAGLMLSPRSAPPNFGLGLLEAVPASTITALANATDAVTAGVAGRPNYVWDPTVRAVVLGRFGLKANVGSIAEQVAAAYNADMGVTNSVFPAEPCNAATAACMLHDPDISDSVLAAVTAYVRTLAVPARRNVTNATVEKGEALFTSSGCVLCHTPTLRTGSVDGAPQLSNQVIHPYTDLLLHDMGPGLADGRPDYLATGREWRTAPLWGIGLTEVVSGGTPAFLHDGRARSLLEAIMWHGGQGAAARERVRSMSAADRAALLAFLQSL
jgi:CxxC motif-containing protein (DUF1111 family)